jgi:hypothetical protein
MADERELIEKLEGQGEFSARMSEDMTRCEITISGHGELYKVRLTREDTFLLGQTLLLMTGSMHDRS